MTKITRRDFIKTTSTAAAACAVPVNYLNPNQDTKKLKIKRYKPFGNTGFMVGDISAGAGQRDPGMVQYLVDSGINLIDSARQYGNHEEVLGQSWSKVDRKKMFIISKWSPKTVTPTVTKQELMEALDESLQRLKTSYVDCMMIHSIGNPGYGGLERIENPAIYEAFDEAKKLGKIRFTGASSHSVNVLNEIGWGVDNGRFEVILLGANFLTRGLEPLLAKAKAKGIATIAMKTMTIFKSDLNIPSLRDNQTNSRQAVIKHILSSDLFDTMIVGMGNITRINEYLAVSGATSMTNSDEKSLAVLREHISPVYCRPGCDGCYGSCKANVPVWDVLRYKMYFENYGREKYAIEKYMEISDENNANACIECKAPCEKDCQYNLPLRSRLIEAHSQLTLT